MYVLPAWDQLPNALRAVALSQCGGTLTLQTQVAGTRAADPFTYQQTAILSPTGANLPSEPLTVTTTSSYPSGTFDFDITDGSYVTVEIQPTTISNLTGYAPSSWSCRAGTATRTFTNVDIANTTWKGIRVRVAANEAVSCIQTVTRTTG
jgi:hypothetical protein